MNNIDKRIEEIDRELVELDSDVVNEKQNKNSKSKKNKLKSQTKKAIEIIRECVNELLNIDDLKKSREENEELHNNRLLTIVSWFNYLKREKQYTKEYEEAKKLIMSVGEKHTKIYDWCKGLIESPLTEYEETINKEFTMNVSENNEFTVKEDLKVIFDLEKVKKYVDSAKKGFEALESLELSYKLVYKDKEYNFRIYYENHIPKFEYDEECPYHLSIVEAKTNENGDYIVLFYVLSYKLIKKN